MKRHLAIRKLAAAFGLALLATAAGAQSITIVDGLTVQTYPAVKGEYQFAHGFGLIYGPMPVARDLKVVERMFPNAKITWQNIFTTAQQRDAMLAGKLHYGSCTVGPFLQGWDKGVDWKWLQTTSGFDAYLMARADGPKSVLEFIGTQKKLTPGPNTAQYFTTQEILKRAGKDPKVLDRNWANLPHPDAMQALIAGQLDGHFATADFALRLEAQGMKKIAGFREVFGALYPVGACTLTKIITENPEVSKGYAEALRKTSDWMAANPEKAAAVMSRTTQGKVSEADFISYIKSPMYGSYSKDAALKVFATSMQSLGAISKVPKGAEEIYAYPADAGSNW